MHLLCLFELFPFELVHLVGLLNWWEVSAEVFEGIFGLSRFEAFHDVGSGHLEDVIEEEEFVQEHLDICVRRVALVFLRSCLFVNNIPDPLFIHTFTPRLNHLPENVLSWQDFDSFISTVRGFVCHHDNLAYQVYKLYIAILFDVLNLECMQFVNESLHKFLCLSLLLPEVYI